MNLPPGVTTDDIERNANGSCQECGRILQGLVCRHCQSSSCDLCGEWMEIGSLVEDGGNFYCQKCKGEYVDGHRTGDGQERPEAGDPAWQREDHAQDNTTGETESGSRAGEAIQVGRGESQEPERGGSGKVG